MLDIQFAASAAAPPCGSPEELDRRVALLSEAGFAGLEFAAEAMATPDAAAHIRALCQRHQIAPLSALLMLEAAATDADASSCASCIDALASLGAEYLVLSAESPLAASARPVETFHETPQVETLRAIAALCADNALQCVYRPSPADLCHREGLLRQSTGEVPASDLGLGLDLDSAAGPGPLEALRRWGDRAVYLRLPLSTSPGTLAPAVSRLDGLGFSGWAVLHAPSGTFPDLPDWAAGRSVLRRAFGC